MKKKILSFTLALCLLATFIPMAATATVEEPPTIVAGLVNSFAIKADGSLWAWGGNLPGDAATYTPVKIMDSVLSVSAGVGYTMAIRTDGSLWAWGSNWYGQLGDGMTTFRHTPVKIMDSVSSVSVGSSYTMAIKTDGSLWSWGYNMDGQLGDGTTTNRHSPVKIMDSVVSVTLAEIAFYDGTGNHVMAIKTDGSLWAWGANWGGVLGSGLRILGNHSPVRIMDSVASVSLGTYHTMAIRTDGSLWAWGTGQLGDGTATSPNSQVRIMDSVASVAAGYDYTMAIKTDGSLWAWGANINGQLGDGTTTDRHSPVRIMDSVSSISAGARHAIAIRTDGSLWAWGSNLNGQLGDGTTTERHSPVRIMDSVASVAVGFQIYDSYSHILAIRTDGSLWAWGSNGGGKIGDGTANVSTYDADLDVVSLITDNNRHSPVKIMDGVMLPSRTVPPPLPPTTDAPPFANPHSVWGREELIRAFDEDLIPLSLIGPNIDLRLPITRAEFAGVAVKTFENLASETIQPTANNPFADTWDVDILKAFNAGIMVGVSPTQFAPNTTLNREQAATALTRVFKRWHFDGWSFATDANFPLQFARPAPFADDAAISEWARESVYFMNSNGIILGLGNNIFGPRAITPDEQARGCAQATREQAILIALRMVENLG